MPATWNNAPSKLRCEEAGCKNRTYTTRSNLARHIKAKHGEPVQMPCGMIRQDHRSNSLRHQLRSGNAPPPTLDIVGAPILDDTLGVFGAPTLGDALGELDDIFDNIDIPILDDPLDEFDNALGIVSKEFNNEHDTISDHYYGFF
ncbi:hypothetical protein CSAL01_09046 [Colletotrichum salicis]|uniref:C2H2-type domain-containing protein n=1 Tax=Colletotrichum salicis TaxID=1209931 RepID=A0A135ULR8_9PEZI|nr:hypothetical protein CSAL01_09046 [Colletotrichum salicis]